jgi:hypothetical protein
MGPIFNTTFFAGFPRFNRKLFSAYLPSVSLTCGVLSDQSFSKGFALYKNELYASNDKDYCKQVVEGSVYEPMAAKKGADCSTE